MSVINKALSELEKRNNNTAYGKYVQPASNGKNKVRIALIATLSVLTVAVIGVAVYRFGGFYGADTNTQVVSKTQAVPTNEEAKKDNLAANSRGEATTKTTKVEAAKAETKADSKLETKENEVAITTTATTSEKKSPADALGTTASSQDTTNLVTADNETQTPLAKEAEVETKDSLKGEVKVALGAQNEKVAIAPKATNKETAVAKANTNSSSVVDTKEQNAQSNDSADDYYVDVGVDAYGEVEAEEAMARQTRKPTSFIKVTKKNLSIDEQVTLYRRDADRAISRGDTKGAIESYRQILAVKPTDSKARERLSGLLFGSGNVLEAVKVLEQGIRLAPAHYDYRLYLARIYTGAGRNAEAIKVLSQATPPVNGNVDYYATLASLARDSGDYAVAEQAYRKLALAETRDGKWYLGLAIVQEKQGRTKEALPAYRNAGQLYLSKASRDFVQKRIRVLEASHHDR